MNIKTWILSLTVLCLATTCSDNDDIPAPVFDDITIDTVNVDIVLPKSYQRQWRSAIDMALQNIKLAQNKVRKRVWLNLRYHNEDTEDLEQLAYDLTHPKAGDDTCHAIIGPYHSDNAQTFLNHAARTRLPVVMPTCTSAELQRKNARNTYAWFLTESDITQCEMMLSVTSVIKATDVTLIYSDNTYGRSFYDWFAFFAAEHNLHIAGDGLLAYQSGMNIKPFLQSISQNHSGNTVVLCLALSNTNDYIDVCHQVEDYQQERMAEIGGYNELMDSIESWIDIKTLCGDTSLDEHIAEMNEWTGFDYGLSPFGDINYGFPQAYEATFNRRPYNGEAQIYDALTLIALGAALRLNSPDECIIDGKQVVYKEAPYGPGLTDYMRSIVSSEEGPIINWTQRGLCIAFEGMEYDIEMDLTGATGNMQFDQETHTKILNTTYMLWQLDDIIDEGKTKTRIGPIIYLNANETSSMWNLQNAVEQSFVTGIEEHILPSTEDYWAVIISPSTTWANYRHQADAFAMYQTLRQHGYDDDHIVLIVEDNLANDPQNIYPGKIFVESPGISGNPGDDVRQNAVVDYHFSQLRPDDIADIMLGRQSARLPHVIHPTSTSNVFFFWSGHGGSKEGPLWGNEDAKEYFGKERIKDIVSEMSGNSPHPSPLNPQPRMYRRMMFAIETCFSGKWGEALTGQPDILVLTAASPYETSKADVFDENLGVFLSNAFARTFRNKVYENTYKPIYDFYKELFRSTNGSHVTIYNEANYGSVYNTLMYDYFPK